MLFSLQCFRKFETNLMIMLSEYFNNNNSIATKIGVSFIWTNHQFDVAFSLNSKQTFQADSKPPAH